MMERGWTRRAGAALALALVWMSGLGSPVLAAEAADGPENQPPAAEDVSLETAEPEPPLTAAERYGDVAETAPYYPALAWCVERGVLDGVPIDGAFQADAPVTRAMLAVMLDSLYPGDGQDGAAFSDVPGESWYAPSVSRVGASGLIAGYDDGTFHPGEIMTREKTASLLADAARSLGYDATPTSSAEYLRCTDVSGLGAARRKDVKWCLQMGLLSLHAGDRFAGAEPLTRAQAVQVLWNFDHWRTGPKAVMLTGQVQAGAVVQDTAQHQAIQRGIEKIAAKYGADGMAVAYIRDGRVADTFAYGAAVKGKTPMTANTKVRIASISKVVVGLGTHLAAQEGVIDLDGDLGQYLGFPIYKARKGDVVTARSILTHTSSLSVAGEGVPCQYEAIRTRLSSPAGVRNVISGSLGNWAYNNYAFSVLGVAVERAGQRTMDELLHRYIYGPLSIDASFYGGELAGKDQIAEIYRAGGTVGLSQHYQMTSTGSGIPGADGTKFAGGLTISAYDLGKIVALLAGDGCYDGVQYISPSVVAALEQHGGTMAAGGFYCIKKTTR